MITRGEVLSMVDGGASVLGIAEASYRRGLRDGLRVAEKVRSRAGPNLSPENLSEIRAAMNGDLEAGRRLSRDEPEDE